jgi:hypothetical protein
VIDAPSAAVEAQAAVPVPEPEILLLFGSAAMLVAIFRKRT